MRNDQRLAKDVQRRWRDHAMSVWCLVYERDNQTRPDPSETGSSADSPDRDFVVFLDPSYAVDWITKGDPAPEARSLIAKAEAVSAVDCDFLPQPRLLEYRLQIAQVIVCALHGEVEAGHKLLTEAQSYLSKRTIEQSREWTLLSLLGFTAMVAVICCIWGETWMEQRLTAPVAASLAGGFLGAFSSVAVRTGKEVLDAASGLGLHFLEVVMRLVVGAIFGIIATSLASSTFGPEAIQAMVATWQGCATVAFGAGLFEKSIPRILSQYSRDQALVLTDDHGTKSDTH